MSSKSLSDYPWFVEHRGAQQVMHCGRFSVSQNQLVIIMNSGFQAKQIWCHVLRVE